MSLLSGKCTEVLSEGSCEKVIFHDLFRLPSLALHNDNL